MSEDLVKPALEPVLELPSLQFEPAVTSQNGRKPSVGGGRPNDDPGAGDGDGFGLARFGVGGEFVRGVPVKVGDPQFTLIWDTDADLDLHVVEPGGKEITGRTPKGTEGANWTSTTPRASARKTFTGSSSRRAPVQPRYEGQDRREPTDGTSSTGEGSAVSPR